MAIFENDYRLNNVFKRIVSSKTFCDKYNIAPGEYMNIAQGKKSSNVIIQALATALQDIENTLKDKEIKFNSATKDRTDFLDEAEMKTIYRKIVTIVTQ